MIIDVHTHLGFDHCYGTDNPEEEFLYYQDLCKIDHAIIQPAVPLSHIEENAAIHDKIYEPAKQFKDVKFIIAHAGGEACHGSAIHVAKLCNNVYLDPSWLMILSLLGDIKAIGAERIMFSTDLALNAPVELAKYNTLPISDDEREWLFSKTAKSVFKLNL